MVRSRDCLPPAQDSLPGTPGSAVSPALLAKPPLQASVALVRNTTKTHRSIRASEPDSVQIPALGGARDTLSMTELFGEVAGGFGGGRVGSMGSFLQQFREGKGSLIRGASLSRASTALTEQQVREVPSREKI